MRVDVTRDILQSYMKSFCLGTIYGSTESIARTSICCVVLTVTPDSRVSLCLLNTLRRAIGDSLLDRLAWPTNLCLVASLHFLEPLGYQASSP